MVVSSSLSKKAVLSKDPEAPGNIFFLKHASKISKELGLLGKLVNAATKDLQILPQRIDNLITAASFPRLSSFPHTNTPQLYNLSNQRDAKASVDLARAALNDSSSMKTIAVITLVFLPATFPCVKSTNVRTP
jgi:hypothetical protein